MNKAPDPEVALKRLNGFNPDYYRDVLQYFGQQSETVASVDDLEAYIREQDLSDAAEHRILIRLHHVILPKLDDAGLIDYDLRSNMARSRENGLLEQTEMHQQADKVDSAGDVAITDDHGETSD